MPTDRANRPSYAEALDRLRSAQKPPHGTAAYSRFINRPWGRRIAAWAAARGLTPNQVTVLSAACTGLALVLLATVRADTVTALTVAFLLCLGYALDSADGQVSRLTGSGSPRGEWLDHMVDCTKTAALHLCVLIHLVRFTDLSGWELLVPLAYAVVDQVTFFGQILTDQLRRTLDIGPARNVGSLSVVRSLALLPADYGFLALLFSTLAWPHIFWWFYAGMLLAASALLLVALVRWWQMLPGPRQAKP